LVRCSGNVRNRSRAVTARKMLAGNDLNQKSGSRKPT
jgi:hypothetical protein